MGGAGPKICFHTRLLSHGSHGIRIRLCSSTSPLLKVSAPSACHQAEGEFEESNNIVSICLFPMCSKCFDSQLATCWSSVDVHVDILEGFSTSDNRPAEGLCGVCGRLLPLLTHASLTI